MTKSLPVGRRTLSAGSAALGALIDGGKLVRSDGRGFVGNADGIALSRDGATLHWQPLTGRTLYITLFKLARG